MTGLQAPPPSAMLRVASLGRPQAAADVLWLRLVSFIGSDTSEANGYLGIETFLDRITDLAPQFSLPYWMGGILLATSPGRSEAADQILAKGERKYPDDWEFSQWRGFVAYFGEMDIPKALQHYKNAVAKPGHAPYLRSFIKRLEASQTDCFAMSNSMSELVAEKQSASTRDLLVSRAGKNHQKLRHHDAEASSRQLSVAAWPNCLRCSNTCGPRFPCENAARPERVLLGHHQAHRTSPLR